MNGIQAFLEVLHGAGVRHIFGNPGTMELPLNDALVEDDRFQYVLGLQEVPVVAMADGYAMASGQVGVVNVHICCGLGNSMGMLYNAYREGTPLLVTAGQQDRRLVFEEPILAGDMVSVTRPWTKWSHEVGRVEDLPVAARRAVQTALTPPTGPVFLSLPMDVQMELVEANPDGGLDVSPPRVPDRRMRPPLDALQAAAQVLSNAENPAILAGSRVTEAGAVDELVALAELLGAPVFSEGGTTHGRLAFPSDHPLYGQGLPLWSPQVRERLEPFDAILVTGMNLLQQYLYDDPSRAVPGHVRIVHLDEDPWQLGKNYPTEVGLIGDTKTGLAEIAELMTSRAGAEQRAAWSQRGSQWAQKHDSARERFLAKIDEQRDQRPLTPPVFMEAIARVLPDDVAVIEEAVTTTNTTLERLGALRNTSGYFGHRGWALGWGMGVTLGVQLAWPDRPVLGIIGEGSAMYGIQALWSAARYRIPAVYVIPNNASYQILKICARKMHLPQAQQRRYEALDLGGPEIDFVALSKSLGVSACRLNEPDELSDRLQVAFQEKRPLLIEVPIAGEAAPDLKYG